MLTKQQFERYKRQIVLPEIGVKGQRALCSSKVLVVGAGGLGAPVIMYLAASGIGTLGIADFDTVDASNLQRQVIHTEKSIGLYKTDSAKAFIESINSGVSAVIHNVKIDAINAISIISKYDLVVDATDNFKVRYLINDACFFLKKPMVSASILGFDAQVSVFNAENGPCYRCLFPTQPPSSLSPSCNQAGVIGALPGIAGSIQANEAIKQLLNVGDSLSARLLCFNSLMVTFDIFEIERDHSCILCGESPSIKSIDGTVYTDIDTDYADIQVYDISVHQVREIGIDHAFILDVRDEHELEIADLGATNIPYYDIKYDYSQIPTDRDVFVLCHKGILSIDVCKFLIKKGYSRVFSISGGIDAWSIHIDSGVRRY